jgi:hypothetical protein
MMRFKSRPLVVLALVLSTGAWLPSCKGAEQLNGADVIAVPQFAPDPATATDHFVTVEQQSITKSRIVLNLVLHDVSQPVFGVALKIRYPKELARFRSCMDGDLFPAGACYANETAPAGSGEVFLARTVSSSSQATPVVGAKTVLRMEFIVYAAGPGGTIAFEAQNLGGGDASAVLDVNGDPILMTWYSGTLSGSN